MNIDLEKLFEIVVKVEGQQEAILSKISGLEFRIMNIENYFNTLVSMSLKDIIRSKE